MGNTSNLHEHALLLPNQALILSAILLQITNKILSIDFSLVVYLYIYTSFYFSQVIPFPSVEELKLHTALPSIVFPSDHIALISDLRFI